MDDGQIVDLYWARQERAIRETDQKYGRYCRSIARNILSNEQDAEESVSDTYLGAWNAMPPHRPAVLQTFLGKLTRRIALKRVRDASREKRGGGEVPLALEELAQCVPAAGSVESRVLAEELTRAMNRFLGGLPVRERRVFLRRYWYLDSFERIAKELGFTPGKTKSMLYRTRGKLRDFLEKEGLL